MKRLGCALLLAATACGGGAHAQMGTIRFDNWLYYQQNFGDTERWQYRARGYFPFAFRDGWIFTQRVDVPFYYTNKPGGGNPDGDWKFGLSDIFVEEIFDTPDVAKNLRLRASVRLVTPTGGESPFGSDQWQVAPGVGFNWRLPDVLRGVSIVPYARYFFGFDLRSPGVTTTRRLDLYPEVDFKLDDKWTPAFYPEQGMSYNDRTNKWFVPIEAMLINQVSRKWAHAFGGSYAIVDDDQLVQARITLFF